MTENAMAQNPRLAVAPKGHISFSLRVGCPSWATAKRRIKFLTVILLLAICVAADDEDKPKHEPVSWQDVSQGVITGALGKPLGTVCEIKGVVEKIAQLSKADSDDAVIFRITTLDGVTLKKSIEVKSTQYVTRLKEFPKPGEEFSYTVYESGHFSGPLSDPRKLLPPKPSGQTNITQYTLCIELNIVTPVKK